jgi:hypothetical protein
MEYRTADYSTSYSVYPRGSVVYRIAEDGARTWREARDMYINGGLVTAHANPDGTVTVFVGTAMLYSGSDLFTGIVAGSQEFYANVRRIATEWGIDAGEPFADWELDLMASVGEARNATDAEIMDHALRIAFPGFRFSVQDREGNSLASYLTVREAREYITGYGEFNDASQLHIRPYHANGRNITTLEV